jgi:pimeloyl-ACP methyl ester carboxylesterase
MIKFALIHSPLAGPLTWKLVAAQLRQRGYPVVAPALVDSGTDSRAYWEQHAESAAQAINATTHDDACLLVGHSGAGSILPAIGERLKQPPSGYIFVDAGLPADQASRLDMMKTESAQWADQFEKFLIAGGRYPDWSDTNLQSLLPDDHLRRQMLKEIHARGLSFFTERISAPEDWSLTPCGYIQFTEAYAVHTSLARQSGWPFIKFHAGHFHMLVEPIQVADALVHIEKQLLGSSEQS